jgi:hypothetical protein
MPFTDNVSVGHLTLLHSAILGMAQTKELLTPCYTAFIQIIFVQTDPGIQDRTHLSTARFMSKAIIFPVSTWNMNNILPTITSLPKEVLL